MQMSLSNLPESIFRHAFELSPDPVLLCNEAGRILWGNPVALRVFEVSFEELVEKVLADLLGAEGEDSRRRASEALDSARTLGFFEFEWVSEGEVCNRVGLQRISLQEEWVCWVTIRENPEVGGRDDGLRESEEKFSKIFNCSTNGMAVTDFDTGIIIDVNPAWIQASGFSRECAVGRTALELGLWPSIEERRRCHAQLALEGRLQEFEVDFMMRGARVPFVVSAERFEMSGRSFTLWEFRNVAARREADEALKQSEAKYRALVETAHDLIWTMDLEGRWTFVNQRGAQQIYGMEPEEMVGRYAADFHIDAGPTLREMTKQSLANGTVVYGHETRHRSKEGRIVDLSFNARPNYDVQGNLCGAVGTASEITHRKSAERALVSAAERLELAKSAGRLGVWDWNPNTNALNWDAQNFAIFGLDPGCGLTAMEVWERHVHPEDRPAAESRIAAAIREGIDLHDTFRVVTPAGETRYVESRAILRRSESGEVDLVIGLNADVSERRKLEEQLRLSQKMEAVGQLAGGIAHDFNNLLSVILGYTDILLSDLPEASPYRDDLAQVLKAATRASSLTGQLLAFSRRSLMEMRILDLNDVVGEAEAMLNRIIGENIEFLVSCESDVPLIRGDQNQLTQVLMNLCVNARDAMPDGGRIGLRTERWEISEARGEMEIDLQPGLYAAIVVEDTGTGMERSVLSRIFEPFFTTKPQGKGTGLGLSVAHGIVRQSGGAIEVDSRMDVGSTFRVFLPAAKSPQPSKPAEERGDHRGSEKVLIVEDEDAVRAIAERVLSKSGYQVTTASNGAEALHLFEKLHGDFDLLLADVVMPGMSGYELAKRLLDLRPKLRVLFMSGYSSEPIKDRRLKEAMVLQKPVTAAKIPETVRRLLDSKV